MSIKRELSDCSITCGLKHAGEHCKTYKDAPCCFFCKHKTNGFCLEACQNDPTVCGVAKEIKPPHKAT